MAASLLPEDAVSPNSKAELHLFACSARFLGRRPCLALCTIPVAGSLLSRVTHGNIRSLQGLWMTGWEFAQLGELASFVRARQKIPTDSLRSHRTTSTILQIECAFPRGHPVS